MDPENSISIWFFIGFCLLFDGLLIFGAGLYQLLGHRSVHHVVLYSLHANIWWGGILAVAGVMFGYTSAPWRNRNKK